MDVVTKRRVVNKTGVGVVVAGSVWESRMKSDEVKGGIKVFNGGGEENNNNNNNLEENVDSNSSNSNSNSPSSSSSSNKRSIMKRGQSGNLVAISGRRKTWKSESFEGFEKNPIQINKDLSVSVDGGLIKKPTTTTRKGRSENGTIRTPIQKPIRSVVVESVGEEIEKKDSIQLKKSKSESGNGIEKGGSSVKLREIKSEKTEGLKEDDDKSVEANEKCPIGSDEEADDLCCEEKVISSEVLVNVDDVIIDDEEEEFDEEEIEEIEKKSVVDIKEINVLQEEEEEEEIQKPKKFSTQFNNKTAPFSSTVNKQPPPVIKKATIYSNFSKPPPPPVSRSVSDEYHHHYQNFPQNHNNLQNLVDLIMWRDVSKSAFIFGLGTFIIISSSYTNDLNISFISVISYLGLVYLAAIFLYRTIICRGVIDMEDTSYVLGEQEAIWLLKLFLPYLNEFLLKLKALFSGDPSTTMKLAVLLFVSARCGNSITIWKMAKLGFFGVFIIPKICSSYSTQLTAYGTFWIRRFRDAWDSCSHKKAVAGTIFTLVWNLSSIVARVWAVFMLFVAVRYYQQSMVQDDWVEDGTTAVDEDTWQGPIGRRREEHRPTVGQVNKPKKGC